MATADNSQFQLWSWGANGAGQLGQGYSSEEVSLPTRVDFGGIQHFSNTEGELQVSSGGSHTIIYKNGSNDGSYTFYHLGLISTKLECPREQQLTKVTHRVDSLGEMLVSGWDFSLFLTSDGDTFSIGDNSHCQLGRSTDFEVYKNISPCWKQLSIPKLQQISTKMRHVMGIGVDSSLIAWGDNSKGQTGLNLDLKFISHPTFLTDIPFKPILVRCSKSATIVLAEDGFFYGVGLNKFGMLGDHLNSKVIPQFTKLFSLDKEVQDFQCGWTHVLVLCTNGQLISWGRNNFCQLGRKYGTSYDASPGLVEGLPELIGAIACGSEHNLVIGVSGQVYSWGWNEHDNCGIQGGHGQEVIPYPTKVPLPPNQSAVDIECGCGSSYALTKIHL